MNVNGIAFKLSMHYDDTVHGFIEYDSAGKVLIEYETDDL